MKLKNITDGFRQAYIKLSITATGGSTNITSALTSALATAGKGGVSVPLQLGTGSNQGVIASNSRVKILVATTETEVRDASGNEVYGKLTEATGVYTVTYFSNVSGTETAYTSFSSTAIDVYIRYRFSVANLPEDYAIALAASFDATGSSSSVPNWFSEILTVSATNTVSNLTKNPTDNTLVMLIVDNAVYDAKGGGTAHFTVASKVVTWSQTNAGMPINTGDRVLAYYPTLE